LALVALGSARNVKQPEKNQFREIITAPPSGEYSHDHHPDEPLLLKKRQTTCGTASVMAAADQQSAVSVHNSLRAGEKGSNMIALTFSQDLANRAQQWTNTCNWYHGMFTSCADGHQIGQNLYMIGGGSTYPTFNATAAIVSWFNEKPDFNPSTKICAAGKECGHYTQLVWGASGSMGCGWTKCPKVAVGTSTWTNCIIFGCDYDPPGNVDGESMYEVGTVCSQCANVMTTGYVCQNNLCNPCSKSSNPSCQCPNVACQNGGVFDNVACSCKCSTGHFGYNCGMNCTCADNMDCSSYGSYCTDPSYSAYMAANCAKSCNMCPQVPATCTTG
jgi:hypothetical protein